MILKEKAKGSRQYSHQSPSNQSKGISVLEILFELPLNQGSTALIISNRIRIDISIIRVQRDTQSIPCHHLRRSNHIQIIHINVRRRSLDAEDPRLAASAVSWGYN
jgi:hypothetical protein